MMQFTAEQIAAVVGGTIYGAKGRTVWDVAPVESAQEGQLTFITDDKNLPQLSQTQASIVLITSSLLKGDEQSAATIISVANARGAMGQLLQMVSEVLNPRKRGIEQPSFISEGVQVPESAYVGAMAYIGKNVKIGENVQIYPQVYIGDNVQIGDNTILYSGVKVYYNCVIGKDCILQSGVVIGGDGFGFEPDAQGVYHKIPQIGRVVIEDDVEIGANSTVDRAMMGETRVRRNAKIDNLVMVAHNVQIGESTVLCGQVGIAGSTKVGSHCLLTGQVGVAGHIEIADNCIFGAQSGVSGSVRKPGTYLGSPALDAGLWKRCQAVYRHLPEMYKKMP